jgi:hypothetical protein
LPFNARSPFLGLALEEIYSREQPITGDIQKFPVIELAAARLYLREPYRAFVAGRFHPG